MPSLSRVQQARRDDATAASSGERFARALVGLTRTVWHPDCTFDSAIGSICEVAAAALQVERVSVWNYDRDAGELRCLHSYLAVDRTHAPAAELETLSLQDDDYMAALQEVRTLNAADFEAAPVTARSHSALRDYVGRHRIHALLDAPAFVEGQLQGVICHESVGRDRAWTQEEITFAASMGDYVAMAHEIDRRRRAEAELHHLRLHDASTGLPNREYMTELLRQRIGAPRRADETLSVVHVRIDVSDGAALSGGAPTEDEIMVQISLRIRRLCNYDVELARVHSNGFLFLLARNAVQGTAVRLAERCLAAVRAIEWPHEAINPGAAVGIAFSAAAAEVDPRELMRQAEEAADHAHLRERFAYEVFDIAHHEVLIERLRTEHALAIALEEGGFELHYQPEYDAAEQQWVAAEALLRWRDGDQLRSAAEFISVAESSGLILALGTWVLDRACLDAAEWTSTASGAPPTVRVNVSARQFEDEGFVDDVAAALAASGLPSERLCLEITETTLMGNIERASLLLRQLKAIGVKIALDDFGTGYASLVYLKRFPIDALKIDRSFVQEMPGNAVDIAIVAAVAGLADALGIDVVAEGVETVEQQDALQAIGVRRMQGWLYAKAMDQTAIRKLLETPVRSGTTAT